jgi:hypothetical protein
VYVWIAKVLAKPQSIKVNSDGSVSFLGLKLGYYKDRAVARSSKCKMRIFAHLVRAETKKSTRAKKIYIEDVMPELSTSLVMKAFHRSTYVNGKSQTKLSESHVQEVADFAVCNHRYLAWVKDLPST